LRIERVIVLTPKMGGADGISEMTRQWVRVLQARTGTDVDSLEVWSLDDDPLLSAPADVTFRTAGGSRSRFVSFGGFDGFGSLTGTLVIVMHVQLLPVALPLALRGARLMPILMGIESWVPLSPMVTMMLRKSWKVAAISHHTVARVRAANPSMGDVSVTVCQPGVPMLPRPVAAGRDDGFALIVGRMCSRERYKGHDALIELWPRVREVVPDARLVIAGDGDDAPRLRAKAGEGIEFTGRVDQAALAALYRDAALFVMPSRDEGFGLVYLEAMRASVPCIAGRGAAEEVIRNGCDGLIVESGDPHALVASIVRLFLHREDRCRLGAAAAHRAEREFGPAALAQRICAILELGAA
jgi:phosphatidylinositol alpha-1,6-mannosyltransferase